MSAPGQDAAQSEGTALDGQGQDQDRSFSSILGEDAFSSAPPELQEHLAEYVRTQVDPKLTQRFQDAAQFKQTWEPFSQIEGLTDMHPEDVDQLVELGFVMAAAADQNHPHNEQAKQSLQETWEQLGDQFGFFDDEEGGEDGEFEEGGEGGDDRIAQLEAQIQELKQGQQQGELKQTEQQIMSEISGHVDKLDLPGKPGSQENKDARDAVYTFMMRYDDAQMSNEDVVKAAYEDYARLTGASQRQLLEDHEEAGESVTGGHGDTQPEAVHGWKDADRLAKARLSGVR